MGIARKLIWACGALLLLPVITHFAAVETVPSVTVPHEEAAASKIDMRKFAWRPGGFGLVAIADMTIANRNAYAVKDLKLECSWAANSGTRIGASSTTLFERFGAGETRIIKDFNLGAVPSQATRGSCGVVYADRI